MTLAELKSELQTDPVNIGYGTHINSRNNNAIVELINAPTRSGIAVLKMSRDRFLLAITPAISSMPGKTSSIQQKWDRFLNVVRSVDEVHISDAMIEPLVDNLVADELLTSAELSALKTKTGSRAEELWGDGTVITRNQVRAALRG